MLKNIGTLDRKVFESFLGTELAVGANENHGEVEIIVKSNSDIKRLARELGASAEILSDRFAIISLPWDSVDDLLSHPAIIHAELPVALVPHIFESRRDVCVENVWSPDGFALSGAGTLVAIIDSGIDYRHPDFTNDDGSSRILYIWDQEGTGTPPSGFNDGVEYTEEQINAALASPQPYTVVPQQDVLGHGTAVAGIAAGNGRSSEGRNKGMAPKASIISVKLKPGKELSAVRNTQVMRAVKYVFDRAKELGMPLAVNLSYGTNNGSHDGNSLFEEYISDMAEHWKSVISVATGNEGAAGHHYSTKVKQSERTTVEFSVSENLTSLYLVVAYDFVDTFNFQLSSPSGMSSGEITGDNPSVVMHIDNAAVYLNYGHPTPYDADQIVYIQLMAKEGAVPSGLWRLYVQGVNIVDGRIDMWLPTVEDVSNGTAFLRPTTNTTLTIPSTALRAIAVGGYNARIGASAAFSGRGYTRNEVYVKPDLVAPAVNIVSTRVGGGYGTFTGTSMATPFVTGAVALMMEWGIINENDEGMYGQRVKAFLRKGATRQQGTTYPNPIWGYGALCIQASMDIARQSAISSERGRRDLIGRRRG